MNTVYTENFNSGFYDYQGIGELTVPNSWIPSWVQGPGGGVLHRPEYDFKSRQLGHPEVYDDNEFASAVMQTSATHDTALWRQFVVEPGSVVVSGTVMIKSHKDAGHGLVLGIDPRGGVDFRNEADVIWGGWWSQHMDEYKDIGGFGQWHPLDVTAYATGSIVTVFLKSVIDYPAQWGAGIWGRVEVKDSGDSGPPGGNEEVVRDLRELQSDIHAQIESLIVKYSG